MSETVSTFSRRKMIAGAAAFGGLLLEAAGAQAGTVGDVSRANEAIHQEVDFASTRQHVYEALTDTAQFDQVMQLSAAVKSGMAIGNKPTKISPQVGGVFTIYFGHILGMQIELVPSIRIVQAWRVIDWNPGVYSIAKFSLTEHAGGARLIFDHTGFPNGEGQHLADGWKANYWEPLQKYLAAKS
jgi:uncharacterized protein YndB with AHSA1/START domain